MTPKTIHDAIRAYRVAADVQEQLEEEIARTEASIEHAKLARDESQRLLNEAARHIREWAAFEEAKLKALNESRQDMIA